MVSKIVDGTMNEIFIADIENLPTINLKKSNLLTHRHHPCPISHHYIHHHQNCNHHSAISPPFLTTNHQSVCLPPNSPQSRPRLTIAPYFTPNHQSISHQHHLSITTNHQFIFDLISNLVGLFDRNGLQVLAKTNKKGFTVRVTITGKGEVWGELLLVLDGALLRGFGPKIVDGLLHATGMNCHRQ
ncbi:hypothetical protein RJ640_022593, partial [Escallonia rubra]